MALIDTLEDGTSLLRLQPQTGRTHQLRLHLQTVGLPIVGDRAYAAGAESTTGFTRTDAPLCLHAHTLGFHHPNTDQWVALTAPLPDHFGAHAADAMLRSTGLHSSI